jgi:regulator of protease activity HflC (stomatin/prohibitin superfamily)
MFDILSFILAYLPWIILLGTVVFILSLGFRIIRPLEKGVVERLGKFRYVADQGFHVLIPVVDRMYKINLTEQMMDVEPHEVITEDNLNAKVDLVVYYKVDRDDESVKNSIYAVNAFEPQIIKLAQTTTRNVIGTMPFKEVNSQRNKLNTELANVLNTESKAWGVSIVRVEMMEITPPSDVQDTMNKVLKAENEKRSAIDFATATETQADGQRRAAIKSAEGQRQARILEAEGQRQALILEAEGKRQYQILTAEGQSKAFNLINATFKGNAQILKKLETAQASLEYNTKYVIDPHTGITNVIAEQFAGIIPIKENKKETTTTIMPTISATETKPRAKSRVRM